MGVQKMFRLTADLARLDGYKFSITETHHTTKLDAPSGTAITLKEIIAVRPARRTRSRLLRIASATPRANILSARRATTT